MSSDKRGFASMSQEKRAEIASRGGRSAHAKGTAHKFTTEKGREAGAKGGRIISADREHMSRIGRKGAEARARIRDAADKV